MSLAQAEHISDYDIENLSQGVEAGNDNEGIRDREPVESLEGEGNAEEDSGKFEITPENLFSDEIEEKVIEFVIQAVGGTREECKLNLEYEGRDTARFNNEGELFDTEGNSTLEKVKEYLGDTAPEKIERHTQTNADLWSNRNEFFLTTDTKYYREVDGVKVLQVGVGICDAEGRVHYFNVDITPAEKPEVKDEEAIEEDEATNAGSTNEEHPRSENAESDLDLNSEQSQSLVMEAQAEAQASAVVDAQMQTQASEKILTQKPAEIFAEDDGSSELVIDSSVTDKIATVMVPGKIFAQTQARPEVQMYSGNEPEFQAQEIQSDEPSDNQTTSVVSEKLPAVIEFFPASQQVEFSESTTNDFDSDDAIENVIQGLEIVPIEESTIEVNTPDIRSINATQTQSTRPISAPAEVTVPKALESKVENSAEPAVRTQDAIEVQEAVQISGTVEKNTLAPEAKVLPEVKEANQEAAQETKLDVPVAEIEEIRVEFIEDEGIQNENIKIESLNMAIEHAAEVQIETEIEDAGVVSTPTLSSVPVSTEITSEAPSEVEQATNVEAAKVSEPESSLSREIQNMRPEFTGIRLIETSRGPVISAEYASIVQEEAQREIIPMNELGSNPEETASSIAYVTPESGMVFTNEYMRAGQPRGVYATDDVVEAANDNQARVSSRDGITLRIAA